MPLKILMKKKVIMLLLNLLMLKSKGFVNDCMILCNYAM